MIDWTQILNFFVLSVRNAVLSIVRYYSARAFDESFLSTIDHGRLNIIVTAAKTSIIITTACTSYTSYREV